MLETNHLITAQMQKSQSILNALAHIPTKSLSSVIDAAFFRTLDDSDFMRIAVYLALKSYNEGGCPIGGVIIDNQSRMILGKGHNTLVQEDHPYNHGETSAIRDAGRIDFSKTTIFTTLSPCDVCATLIYMRGFARCVVGDITNASGNEDMIRSKAVHVDILEDVEGIALYGQYRKEKPELDTEDWKGVSALNDSTTYPQAKISNHD